MLKLFTKSIEKSMLKIDMMQLQSKEDENLCN